MEDQVSKLIDAMKSLSPEGARIWSEMVAAEASYNLFNLILCAFPSIAFLYFSYVCYKWLKEEKFDSDVCGFLMCVSGVIGVIILSVTFMTIPEWVAGIAHPEGTLAYSIIQILN